MLELKKITKTYSTSDMSVQALKGVSIAFRQSEFVSVLGPSGCGKTTLLNIIGGLDHYSSGDLLIDGVSTKEYKDRDWDTYRNHRIGFIFQSYNLIPHQTILENVELALNIAGEDKKTRLEKAKLALDKVGLSGMYSKKPNQLSGGQCQRVAIARALVGDPEILLADEPTGALDTVTSVQIMELIKEISKERLVIMVTHNPELAEKYSTRIVQLLDGNIMNDSNPFVQNSGESKQENQKLPEKNIGEDKRERQVKKGKKSKLSFWSAFKLSARNLRSKFKRTLLVCLAGSIGIIGVASVLSVSTGIRGFIGSMQDDMLSGNPITIQETALNTAGLTAMSSSMAKEEAVKLAVKDGYVNVNYMIDYLVKQSDNLSSLMVTNEITQEYIDYLKAMPEEYFAEMAFSYGINLSNNIYTDYSFTGQEGKRLSLSAAIEIYSSLLKQTSFAKYSSLIPILKSEFKQAPQNVDFILSQYDILSDKATSKIPSKANEIMIVVDKDTELTDLLYAQLGYYTQEEFLNVVFKAVDDPAYNPSLDKLQFSYDELLGKTFTWYPNDVVFNKTENEMQAKVNPFTYNAYASDDWNGGKELKVTAILRQKEDISYGSLSAGVYYTPALSKEILIDSLSSQIVSYLKETESKSFTSTSMNGMNYGITFNYSFTNGTQEFNNQIGLLGSNTQNFMMMGMGGNGGSGGGGGASGDAGSQEIPAYYQLSLRELGGENIPSKISIYPTDFETKDEVTAYLDKWNENKDLTFNGSVIAADKRSDIIYSDNLAIAITLINGLIDTVTTALIAFTCLSLVVSTVMIAIITYVSVIERVKEIGVIRSLGGRKIDVSNLFNAETFIIGSLSGLIGVGITYGLGAIINFISINLLNISALAVLTIPTALIMIAISIGLTLVSGLIPAKLAAKKDPVVALRTE